ncbi:YraN family protein [Paenibacillus sp. JNUCC31]|uniref:YraN family protein n=1 Tax=Paenibacillus sp. JNUCC-31 TaxID=2777983 RepID=UPI001786C0EB|nr:YraN family protein [Paenibacillus sp. JNUCC-31]QOS78323.1 YraN family protein [Paenibacillus sp. JNUCC-31]
MVERRSEQGPASKLTRQQKGRLGEEASCHWLREHGYQIIRQNWRCRSGEIDIVASHEGMIIFIEVRSRSGTGKYGTPQESVDIRKMQQVRATASVYLQMTGETNHQIRFDVIAVMLDKAGETVSVDHIINAF